DVPDQGPAAATAAARGGGGATTGRSRPDLFGAPPGATASGGGLDVSAPAHRQPSGGGDVLQGLMRQQQEMFRQQQAALGRLQEETEQLRREKEEARLNLLDLKTRQLEEK
ncbi:unnamed protein product, partial [Prorocentrum cordatum]